LKDGATGNAGAGACQCTSIRLVSHKEAFRLTRDLLSSWRKADPSSG